MAKPFQHGSITILLLLVSCRTALSCRGALLGTGITNEEKRIILQEHNKLRQLIATGSFPGQPAAQNMQELVWDDELAIHAQAWANNCEFRHDPHRNTRRFTMGQNLAIIWSTVPLEADDGDFPSRIKNWFNEVHKYSFGASWSSKTGHYSQLVWGDTYLVGCGFAEYKDSSKYNKLYVCNYGPGGNVVGFNPYEVGKPACKSHGLIPSPRYKGLCRNPSYEYKQNQFNTKASHSSLQFTEQSRQEKTQLFPTSLPPFTTPLFSQKTSQSKVTSPFNKPLIIGTNSIGESAILGALFGTNTETSIQKATIHQHRQYQQWNQQQTGDFQHPHIEPQIVSTSPNEIIPQPISQTGWSLLTWRG